VSEVHRSDTAQQASLLALLVERYREAVDRDEAALLGALIYTIAAGADREPSAGTATHEGPVIGSPDGGPSW
jgi:hypothetical protein